jgi:hypothetical protein
MNLYKFSRMSEIERDWLIYQSIESLKEKIDIMNPTLQTILADEAQELANLGTIGSAVNTLVANEAAQSTLIAQLQAAIAAGNTEPADLQQIATALAANDAAITPITAALAAALPPATVAATPAAPPTAQ